LADIVSNYRERVEDLAKMLLYVLMNKIIFYVARSATRRPTHVSAVGLPK
jgi:hypothetical protein